MKRQGAPGRLELVRAFLNSLDREEGTDALTSPLAARGWLVDHDLWPAAGPVPTEPARRRLVEVREAIRAFAAMNTGTPADPAAQRVLERAAAAADVRLRFTADGHQLLAPSPTDDLVVSVLGGLLAPVAVAGLDGTWPRLKVCRAADCRWAFYDHAKNRSGVWCQMAECGNRAKARSFRARKET